MKKKGLKIFLALFMAVVVNAIAIGAFLLWCKKISEQPSADGVTPSTSITAPLTP